jgi:hypothetical protein
VNFEVGALKKRIKSKGDRPACRPHPPLKRARRCLDTVLATCGHAATPPSADLHARPCCMHATTAACLDVLSCLALLPLVPCPLAIACFYRCFAAAAAWLCKPPCPATRVIPPSLASTPHARRPGATRAVAPPDSFLLCRHPTVAQHLRSWNRPADSTASFARPSWCSPTHSNAPKATRQPASPPFTSGRIPSPLTATPVSFFLAPTPKSGSSPRRPPPRPISPLSAPPARRDFGRCRHPAPWGAPPLFRSGAGSPAPVGPARSGPSA